MKVIIDRLEGGVAVVEAGETTYNIPYELIPGAKEGDTVEITVLGKQPTEEATHAIFEKLRRKSRKTNLAKKAGSKHRGS